MPAPQRVSRTPSYPAEPGTLSINRNITRIPSKQAPSTIVSFGALRDQAFGSQRVDDHGVS